MNEQEKLAQVCRQLGASPEQADIMAGQLLKRATQLAAERGTTAEAELKRLLELVTKGRGGQVPEGFVAPAPLPPREPQ